MSDAWINPVTGAYDLTQGVPQRDPAGGLANAVYVRLMTPLGSYWADPALGAGCTSCSARRIWRA